MMIETLSANGAAVAAGWMVWEVQAGCFQVEAMV
jgi:hypothetical protein